MGKRSSSMAAVMNIEDIRQTCVENGGYRTPCLNDKLYLHFKGYQKIENLDPFTGVRCLWLESNGIANIENLEPMKDSLRQLFVQQNCIRCIGTGLEQMTELVAINLSENLIKSLDGISTLTKLNSLQLANNNLTDYEDLEALKTCPSIASLELNKNKIEDPRVIDILAALPLLKVLKLDGNPITRKIPHYRKALICRLKNLTYLDDRPVFPDERLMAEAWGRGGVEAEKLERTRQRKLKEDQDKNRHKVFFKYVERARRGGKEKEGTEAKGWKPVEAKKMDAAEVAESSKPRESIKRYDVHDGSVEVESSTEQTWALPRKQRKECVIHEVDGKAKEAPTKVGRSSKEAKRASRQARLKKCMALVEEQTPEQEKDETVFSKEALEAANKAHCTQVADAVSEVGKEHWGKWKHELDQAEEKLVPDTPEEPLHVTITEECEVVDLDDLD